jgi:hypothetical protein
MSKAMRKRFYELFARAANEARVGWAVLSGIEGYPADIGRDLDVTCRDAGEAKRLVAVFVDCLSREGFRWIVFPSPIWGRRVLGITEDYAAVELHVVSPVRIAGISLVPQWDALEREGGLFPTDPLLRFFKRCLMPALLRGEAWRRKCAETAMPRDIPWWMRGTARKVFDGKQLSAFDGIRLSFLYFIANPISAVVNFVRWRVRHRRYREFPAAPVYQVSAADDAEAFRTLATRSLAEIFTGFICVDDVEPHRVKGMQAAQRLTYLTRPRPDIPDVRKLPAPLQDENELLRRIVENFAAFNERWRPTETANR